MQPNINNLAILRISIHGESQYAWANAENLSDESPIFQLSPTLQFYRKRLPSLIEHVTSTKLGTFGEFRDKLSILNPLPSPDKTLCTAFNYSSHLKELGEGKIRQPLFFSKHPSTLTDPYSPLPLKDEKILLDYEVELGVVIGSHLKWHQKLTTQEAEDSIFGYVLVNDITSRRYLISDNGFIWRGKNLIDSTPIGPWIIPVETMKRLTSFVEPATPELRLTSSIERRGPCQNGSTNEMVFTVTEQLNALLEITPLSPGDLIFTGTPGGTAFHIPRIVRFIGRVTNGRFNHRFLKQQEKSHRYLKIGDQVTTSAEWLGTQKNQITTGLEVK
ncbi:fumarylacetoacetate hydrolase family protein [Bdellovibrionota bacterium]